MGNVTPNSPYEVLGDFTLAANVYECMFILDSNRYARDPHGVQESINNAVSSLDGEILVSRLWSEQKLAYTINGQRKGTYWLTYFRVEGTKLNEFERAIQLNDSVMRSLTLKIDPRLVDHLIAHAKGEVSTEAPKEAVADNATDDAAETTKEVAAE